MKRFPANRRLGKYRIERRIGEGAFAAVYRAFDTIEGIRVALKVPHADLIDKQALNEFRREVKTVAPLDHPNILPIKNADVIDGVFVIASPIGLGTLADRMERRYRMATALSWSEQLLSAVAYAHGEGIIHCDVKPENLILFEDDRLRLADFGVAKLAQEKTSVIGSGTGTVGYLAPEQAFGNPSRRSDVFSIGLVMYRLFSGTLPWWPYHWPPPGIDRLRTNVSRTLESIIARAITVDERKRFPDAEAMLAAFKRARPQALRGRGQRRPSRRAKRSAQSWRDTRVREFKRQFGKTLETRHTCSRCHSPVSESMLWCPWCGRARNKHRDDTRFPGRCTRCRRGVKKDWTYCAWCYGGAIQEPSTRDYTDVRYEARCSNQRCSRRDLMPFMRYCPWCRSRVTRKWKLDGGKNCRKCAWGVADQFWSHCPWCGANHPAGKKA